MNRGVIIVGYQGIGKSTISNKSLNYVDLESSNFNLDEGKVFNWQNYYCKIAISLASQGYAVFVSSHKVVRDYLITHQLPAGVNLISCVPSHELREEWIKRLEDRYLETGLDKDMRALKNALERYDENIDEILCDIPDACVISSMQYNLEKILFLKFQQLGILYYPNTHS